MRPRFLRFASPNQVLTHAARAATSREGPWSGQTLCSIYHARMARRAQHLRCSPCEIVREANERTTGWIVLEEHGCGLSSQQDCISLALRAPYGTLHTSDRRPVRISSRAHMRASYCFDKGAARAKRCTVGCKPTIRSVSLRLVLFYNNKAWGPRASCNGPLLL